MPTTTRQLIWLEVARRLFQGRAYRDGVASGSGSTTTLVDSDLASSMSLTSALVGSWIIVYTSSAPEIARISTVTLSTGTLTLDRAVTSTTSSTVYAITYNLNPEVILNAASQTLRNTYFPRMFPLSSYILTDDDNDMEATSTISGLWTSSGATPTKAAITQPFPHGTQMLTVTGVGAGDYSRPEISMPVVAGHQYAINVFACATAGDSAELQAYDASNSAEIDDAVTDEAAWMNLGFQFTPPTNCEQLQARLICVAAGDVTHWKDLSVRDLDNPFYVTPSWLTKESQMLGVVEAVHGDAGPGGDNEYKGWGRSLRPVTWRPASNTLASTNELALWVERGGYSPRYIYAMAPASSLTSDTATTFIDLDVAVENALQLIKYPERSEKILRDIRERTMKSQHEVPKGKAMAHFA